MEAPAVTEGATLQDKLNAFMKEPVEFDMPSGWKGWSQSTSVSMSGMTVTKTTTRTITMQDGKEQKLTKVE